MKQQTQFYVFFSPYKEFSKVQEYFLWIDIQPLSLCDPPLDIGKPSQNGHQNSQAQLESRFPLRGLH